jgi:ornithine carbamoyltransferase
VPVINGLSDLEHPCQAIGDVFTMLEKFGHLGGISIAYLGDGNNVANSLILASALMGMSVTVATPVGFEPRQDIVATASRFAKASGGEVAVVKDPLKAVAGADIVYTDVWVSMGNEDETEARKRALAPYQVNDQVMRAASEGAIFLHCLPAHRGEEVTDDVMDGSQSAVWQQAENRMHAQKAILLSLIG